MADRRADVLVIGGGPAGSTAAGLLAREGRSVVLVDRARSPRYHIGESLLPGVLLMLDELGAREAVEAHGFERKTGQTFVWGEDRTPWQFSFSLLEGFPYSFFVERARFDEILLRNAARLGATLLEDHRVVDFLFEGERIAGARVEGPEGPATITARFVVDASGQQALLATRFRLRRFVRGLRNLAVWSYWTGAERLKPPEDAHIFTLSIRDGWIWFIPLREKGMSVGIVTYDTPERRGSDLTSWYEATLRETPEAWALLGEARRHEEVRAQRDWSYASTRFCGPGFVLAGDAACFIDPLLSTGVHLAMSGGYLAALALHSALAEPEHEAHYLRYFEEAYRSHYREQLESVKYFYRVEARRDSVYWKAKQLLRLDPNVDDSLAFLFINSGLARHVSAAMPHDLPGQARALFASQLGALAGPAVPYSARAPARQLLRPGAFRIVEGRDRRLYGLVQRGMRLVLEPAQDGDAALRAPGSACVLELELGASREPIGLVVVEPQRPDTPARVLSARGFSIRTRAYARDPRFEGALADAARRIQGWVAESAETSLPDLGRALRRRLRSAAGVRLSRPPRSDRLSIVEQPVSAEFERTRDGGRLWVVARPRRPVEVASAPFVRTRFVDVEYRTSFDDREADGTGPLLDLAVAAIRRGVAGARRAADALGACADALGAPGELPAGWRLVVVRRLDAVAQCGS